ncbi:hypothetical protein [Planctomicrobium sp. SH527]|uniref:hypothetical protein n=1 Tax=Planctomicrobium sp. SH527 TaxID=3448123 RepID=UPI003F5C0980
MIPLLGLRLICGLAVTCLALPLAELPPRFLRLQLGVIFAAAIVTLVTAGGVLSGGAVSREWIEGVTFAFGAGLGLISLITLGCVFAGQRLPTIVLLNLLAVGSLLGVMIPVVGVIAAPARVFLLMLDALLSSAVLGSVFTAAFLILSQLGSESTGKVSSLNLFPIQKTLALIVLATLARLIGIFVIPSSADMSSGEAMLLFSLQILGLVVPLGVALVSFRMIHTCRQSLFAGMLVVASAAALAGEVAAFSLIESPANQLGI